MLWRVQIVVTLRQHSAYCTEAGLMLKIKNLVMLFASTLTSYGYNVDRLYELLQVQSLFTGFMARVK